MVKRITILDDADENIKIKLDAELLKTSTVIQ